MGSNTTNGYNTVTARQLDSSSSCAPSLCCSLLEKFKASATRLFLTAHVRHILPCNLQMAPKKKAGAKKAKSTAKKVKAPEYITDDADCMAFGLKFLDIVRTPLGLTGKVLGVKYDVRQAPTTTHTGLNDIHEAGHLTVQA